MYISYAHISNDNQTLNLQHDSLSELSVGKFLKSIRIKSFLLQLISLINFIKRFGMPYGVAEQR